MGVHWEDGGFSGVSVKDEHTLSMVFGKLRRIDFLILGAKY